MKQIRWYPCGPQKHEAAYGPYVARMTHEEPGWSKLVVYHNGVWDRRIWAAPAKLRRGFREIVERYELERDRQRLDFLEEHGSRIIHVLGSFGSYDEPQIRKAIDVAMARQAAGAGGTDT